MLAIEKLPVNGNVVQLKNPQIIRMQNIDVLFESETHNSEDTKVLVKILKFWNETSYTSGHVARNAKGRAVGYNAPDATKWDAYGILLHLSDSVEQADRLAVFMEGHLHVKGESLVTYSDDKEFYEVIGVFRDTVGYLAELSQRSMVLTKGQFDEAPRY